MENLNRSQHLPKWREPVLWILQILVAVAFIAAGGAKLIGAAPMVAIFDAIGFGQGLRYLTGAIEVIGAVLLLFPGRTAWGAAILAATMVGAVLTHLLIIGGSPVPALALLTLSLVILWTRRAQLPGLAGGRSANAGRSPS